MTEIDQVMQRLGVAIGLAQAGDRVAAAAALARLWEEVGPDGDPFHRCAISHWMADVQDDANDELVWDLRALDAARLVTQDRATAGGVASSVAAMYPSLHLNLGDAYRRLGEHGLALEHLRQGLQAAEALSDDGYGQMIRNGLDRLGERLGEPGAARS